VLEHTLQNTLFVEIKCFVDAKSFKDCIVLIHHLSALKQQMLFQCSGKMYIRQAMITCTYLLFDDSDSFCLWNMLLGFE